MKKKISIVLCLILCMTVITACNDKKDKSSSKEETTAVTKITDDTLKETIFDDETTSSKTETETTKQKEDVKTNAIYANGVITVKNNAGEFKVEVPDDFDDTAFDNIVNIGDYNFDGKAYDISLLYSQGVANSYYYYWLFDADKNEYVYNKTLSELSYPEFNYNNKTFTSYNQVSGGENFESTYKWNGSDFELTKKRVQEALDSTIKISYYTYSNGVETLDKSCEVSFSDATEMGNAEEKAVGIATDKYNIAKPVSSDYMGVEEINGVRRHKVEINVNDEKVMTIYLKVGDLSDVVVDEGNGLNPIPAE